MHFIGEQGITGGRKEKQQYGQSGANNKEKAVLAIRW